MKESKIQVVSRKRMPKMLNEDALSVADYYAGIEVFG